MNKETIKTSNILITTTAIIPLIYLLSTWLIYSKTKVRNEKHTLIKVELGNIKKYTIEAISLSITLVIAIGWIDNSTFLTFIQYVFFFYPLILMLKSMIQIHDIDSGMMIFATVSYLDMIYIKCIMYLYRNINIKPDLIIMLVFVIGCIIVRYAMIKLCKLIFNKKKYASKEKQEDEFVLELKELMESSDQMVFKSTSNEEQEEKAEEEKETEFELDLKGLEESSDQMTLNNAQYIDETKAITTRQLSNADNSSSDENEFRIFETKVTIHETSISNIEQDQR